MADSGDPDLLRCSFCGKSQKQVKKLIAGPSVYICDGCVDLSTQLIQAALLEEDLLEAPDLRLEERPTPQAIHTIVETGGFSDLEAWIVRLAAKGTSRYAILDELDLWDHQKFVHETVRRVFRECSFCGKDVMHVKALIAGPADFICDECIDLCYEIIEEETEEVDGESVKPPLPPPREPPEASPREEIRRANLSQLTDREKEVLELLVRGLNGAQIASALGTSKDAVRTYIQSLLGKLRGPSRLQAAARWVRHYPPPEFSSEARPGRRPTQQDPRCRGCSAMLAETLTIKELEVGVGDEPRKVRIAYCGRCGSPFGLFA